MKTFYDWHTDRTTTNPEDSHRAATYLNCFPPDAIIKVIKYRGRQLHFHDK